MSEVRRLRLIEGDIHRVTDYATRCGNGERPISCNEFRGTDLGSSQITLTEVFL